MTNQMTRGRAATLKGVAGFLMLTLLLFAVLRFAGVTGPARILVVTVGTSAMVAWWIVFALGIFKARDEYLQHAERHAWYWGGLIGLVASVPVFVFIGAGGLQWLWPEVPGGREVGRAFVTGYVLPTFMQVTGALAVGLWWRLARR